MQRGLVAGLGAGAASALVAGMALALLPTTPTWALWRLTEALDRGDLHEVTRMVDVPAVTLRAMHDLQTAPSAGTESVNLGRLALAVLTGERIGTVFDDPDHPLDVSASDFLAAWWSMRRDDGRATLTLRAGDRRLDLILQQNADLDWKVVGITPIDALLRIEKDGDRA